MKKAEKIVKAKIKNEGELGKVSEYCKTNKDTSFFLNDDSSALCSEITVSHFADLGELAKNLSEEHLSMVNMQLTIRAMDAERGKMDCIIRDKPQSINKLIKASGLTPEQIAKKLGISI